MKGGKLVKHGKIWDRKGVLLKDQRTKNGKFLPIDLDRLNLFTTNRPTNNTTGFETIPSVVFDGWDHLTIKEGNVLFEGLRPWLNSVPNSGLLIPWSLHYSYNPKINSFETGIQVI